MISADGTAVYPWNHGETLTAAALNAAIAQGAGANPGGTPPSAPTIGTLWYNSSTGLLLVWDGAAWQSLSYLPLAGGTVTGATTFSAALNATGGGSLGGTFSGNPTLSGTLTLNPASGSGIIAAPAGKNLQVSMGGSGTTWTLAGTGGTGNLVVATANSAGNTIDMSPAVTLLKTRSVLLNPGGVQTLSGAYDNTKTPLSMAYAVQGTVTSGAGWYPLNQWNLSSDALQLGAGNTGLLLDLEMNVGGGGTPHTGNRSVVKFALSQKSASGNTFGSNPAYQGGQASSDVFFNEGGTALTTAAASGSNYGWPVYARLRTGATNWTVNKGSEVGIAIETGASALKNIGWDICLNGDHAVQGTFADYAYGVIRQSGAAVGFRVGIQFGTYEGIDPFQAGSTIIKWAMGNGSVPTAQDGIDFRAGNLSRNAWASTNATIKGDGTAYFSNAQIARTANGMSIDVSMQVGSYVSMATGGVTQVLGDYYTDNADLPAVWTATAVTGGSVTTVALVNGSLPYSASAPATLTLTNLNPARAGTAPTINVLWAARTTLSLNPSGGPVAINNAANIRSGTGAASGTQPKGSIWMRTDGAVGSTMYISQGAGVWNAVAGV